ncbi:MAG: hypothetical protein H6974_12870 [Gammaproteobacteria bacterium]|nr:hypothetical protein [Gammaproteobacteria bacterium]
MAITLGALTLPATLVWADECDWSPVSQKVDYSTSGALILQEAIRLAGRPITLVGQSDGNAHTGGILRSDLLTLYTALTTTGVELTLTLHDARTFTVAGRHQGEQSPIDAVPLPAVKSLPPAIPASNHWYLLRALRLITV